MQDENAINKPAKLFDEEIIEREQELDEPEGVVRLMEQPFDPTQISIDTKTPMATFRHVDRNI